MSSASAEIRIVYTALATLVRAPRNPKQHDHAALRTSMTRWGFTQPLALNEATGKLVEGHGRLDVLQALKAEGATPPTRITVKGDEWFVPVVRGLSFPTEAEAEAYLVAANQLTIAGGWDEGLLGETIASLRAAQTSFDGLGFDQGQLDQIAASFAPAVQQVVATLPPVAPVPPVAPPAAPVLAESTITASDGQYVPPPTAAGEGVDPSQIQEAEGVLDPTNHIPNEHPRRTVRLLTWGKFSIPVTPEEGAALEAAIAAWQETNGSLYGFITSILG